VSGSPEQQSLEKDRVFSDVNLESLWCPSSNCLNEIRWNPIFSQRGRTTSTHGMTCDVGVKEELHSVDEEWTGWSWTVSAKPEVRRKRKETIARAQICNKPRERVDCYVVTLNDDCVPFKNFIRFTGRREEAVIVIGYNYGCSCSEFTMVDEWFIVRSRSPKRMRAKKPVSSCETKSRLSCSWEPE
jgi:hypothetical protein